MRLIALCLTLFVPAVATAQLVASASVVSQGGGQEAPFEDRLDVLPAAAADATLIASSVVGLATAACVIVTGLTQDDVTFNQSLIAAGVCGVLAGAAVCVNAGNAPGRVRAESGAAYSLDAVAAFATDVLSPDQQASLAASAREAGRAGVVLQRIVETRSGVGSAPGQVLLEVAVVDAESGALRRFSDGALLPQTVASVPVRDDLSSARAEALDSFSL